MKHNCKHCKKPARFKAGNYAVCSAECASEIAMKALSAKKRRIEREERKVHSKRKADFKDNDLNHQHGLTKTAFNRMRVLQCKLRFYELGQKPECISCGQHTNDWCCGHFKTVGQAGHLRYDPKNTHLQCNRYCNMGLSGNITGNKTTRGYIKGLVEVYGKDEGMELFDHCEINQYSTFKWTCAEVKAIRLSALKEIRRLEPIIETYEATI